MKSRLLFKRALAGRQGFTLIELLVVIAVIGILSSIVMASLNSARTKARDAKRQADIRQLQTAIQLYYDDYGTFPSDNGSCNTGQGAWCCLGHGDMGTCWYGGSYHGSTVLDNSLAPKYIPTLSDDPRNNIGKMGDAYMYLNNSTGGIASATLHWGIENPNPTVAKDCLGGFLGQWPAGTANGADYYCQLYFK